MSGKTIYSIIAMHVIAFAIIFIIYYPPMYTIDDESNYLGMSFVLKQGHVFPDMLYMKFGGLLSYNNHLISKFPIGTSLLMVPFAFFGWRATFMLNFFLHLISFFIFIKILLKLQLSPLFSLLYLYYLPLSLHMRTLMSDIPAAFFTICAFYCYLRKGKWFFLAGVLLGFSMLVRFSNVFIVGAFIVILLWDLIQAWCNRSSYKNDFFALLSLVFGCTPFILFSLLYNWYTLGNPLLTVYSLIGKNYFHLKYFFNDFIYYFKATLLMYPLMLVAILIYKGKERRSLNVLFWALFLIYSFYYYTPNFGSGIQNVVVGMRYLLPVIFLAIITYADVIEKIKNINTKIGASILILMNLLIIPYGALSYTHYNYQQNWQAIKNFLYSNTTEKSLLVCDGEIPKLIQFFWGKRDFTPYNYFEKKLSVEPIVDKALKEHNDVYLAFITRPTRDQLNEFSMKYGNMLLEHYGYESRVFKELPAGKIAIYKIKAKK